ncbi:MAG: glycoside hydrolase family 20 zincin-like fold domain-containing protein, partial [Myxococcota bacterium]
MPKGLPPLLPEPKRARREPGTFRLRPELPIALRAGSGADEFLSARALRDAVEQRCGLTLPIETHGRREDLVPRIELSRGTGTGEAHRLQVTREGATLSADGPPGLRFAVETLAQLVDARGRVPCCTIEDAPDLPRRGVMLDVSRGKVPTLETLCAIVDFCVRVKLNVLMLYVEHTFRFRRHPEIGADASPLDAETLRELDAYAAARHVELVPSLQSLGHMDHVLNLPAYAHLAETERNWTLSPALPETYAFLGDLYDEYLPNFRSGLFNANCDESFDLGLGRAAAMRERLGEGGPFLAHVRRVRELARARGKRTMIWADMVHAHPERLQEFEDDFVFLDWWYEAECDYDRVKRFAERGVSFWVCPGTSSWNCLFPRVENSLRNIDGWAEAARRHGAEGLLVTDWGDFGHYNLQGNSWFGYAWAAQQAWSGAVDARRFDRAFARQAFEAPDGEPGRLYRALGAIHDAGFRVFNGSPLQFLFFDDLDTGFFIEGGRPAALNRCQRRLEAVRARIERARSHFAREPLSADELLYAADASLLAVRKALAGARYLAWRRERAALSA